MEEVLALVEQIVEQIIEEHKQIIGKVRALDR